LVYLTLILHKEIRNVIVGPLYVFRHMAYGSVVEGLNNDDDYMIRILCSVIVMFLVRKQNLAGYKFIHEREVETGRDP
jgi:hypothetical protein